ncbi:MAG: hypothetical protein Q8T08_14055, partial [Ignavibacteria bacterium]|nr:hypothetical protein [Ignavibacteria bacterium]
IMGIGGCEDKNEIYPEASIVTELPKINVIGNNTNSIIIQSQKELEAVFTKDELQQVNGLQQIDFSKHTLLLGYGDYNNEVSNMEHSFVKTNIKTYTYLLKIAGDATRPDTFRFGILVVKLPISAEVIFRIEKLN